VNLTAFETIFDERRPFFIEGNELLTGRGQSFIGRPSWFYSRRIGARRREALHQATSSTCRRHTTIATAAKVTGRLASGLSIGALAAVTPREYAHTFDTTTTVTERVAVEPPSSFGVVRLQQEFGSRQSNVGAALTHVHRWLDDRGGLQELLPRDALAGGVDWRLRYMEGMYEVTGWLGRKPRGWRRGSDRALQRGSAHYFQRPDQDHISYDPTRTSLRGTASIRSTKRRAVHARRGADRLRSPSSTSTTPVRCEAGTDIDYNADFRFATRSQQVPPVLPVRTSFQGGLNSAGSSSTCASTRTSSSHSTASGA
jgi:hypothetical protein